MCKFLSGFIIRLTEFFLQQFKNYFSAVEKKTKKHNLQKNADETFFV